MNQSLKSKCLADAPSVAFDAHVDYAVVTAKSVNKLTKCPSFTLELDSNGVATPAVLLGVRGPSAILFRVSKFWIDSINRMFVGWRDTHVGHEGCERFSPRVTHKYSGTAVALKTMCLWIGCALNHRGPNSVKALLGRYLPFGGGSVFGFEVTGIRNFFGASTRGRSTNAAKNYSTPDCSIPAVTKTQPLAYPAFWGLFQHKKFSNTHSGQVDLFHAVYCNWNGSRSQGGVF